MDILAVLSVILVLVFIAVFFFAGGVKKNPDITDIVSGSQPGDTKVVQNYKLTRSYNQKEGIEYSYEGWILIKDFTTGYGKRRRIMSKNDSPGIYLDGTSNSLIFVIDTFGAKESIMVTNIPAMKWLHFAIVVNQTEVDIFINGTLKQHHTLNQLPKQNDDPIVMGPDWNGVLARTRYYAYELKPEMIKRLSRDTPPDDLIPEPARPQYFDLSWYLGRLYSK